jgi:hypothetical protein
MTFPGESSAACDADASCRHAACFQIQLEASQPEQAYRQAVACAYHVADVIEALRAWARERDLAGGQLTILAIEPAAGGRQLGGAGRGETGSGSAGGSAKTAALREFAFSTIPLKTIPPGPAPHREPTG